MDLNVTERGQRLQGELPDESRPGSARGAPGSGEQRGQLSDGKRVDQARVNRARVEETYKEDPGSLTARFLLASGAVRPYPYASFCDSG
jgi:hypothetical protein